MRMHAHTNTTTHTSAHICLSGSHGPHAAMAASYRFLKGPYCKALQAGGGRNHAPHTNKNSWQYTRNTLDSSRAGPVRGKSARMGAAQKDW